MLPGHAPAKVQFIQVLMSTFSGVHRSSAEFPAATRAPTIAALLQLRPRHARRLMRVRRERVQTRPHHCRRLRQRPAEAHGTTSD